MHSFSWPGSFLTCLVILTVFSAGCGGNSGDDDFSDLRATATAAATRAPSPEPTANPVISYYTTVGKLAGELADLAKALNMDMLAAAETQGDPKWPALLTTDADLVIAKAQALGKVSVPAEVPPDIAGNVAQAVERLTKGASLLKEAIAKLDPAIGAEAAVALDDGARSLDKAREAIRAKQ